MSDIRKLQKIRDWIKQRPSDYREDFSEKCSTLGIIEGIGFLSRELRKTETTVISLQEQRKASISKTLGITGLFYAALLNATDITPPPDSLTLTYNTRTDTLGSSLSAILGRLAYLARCNFEAKDQFDHETIGELLRPLNHLSHHLTHLPILTHMEAARESAIKIRDWIQNQTAITATEHKPAARS